MDLVTSALDIQHDWSRNWTEDLEDLMFSHATFEGRVVAYKSAPPEGKAVVWPLSLLEAQKSA